MTESATNLFLRQRRFDLIFKFLCARHPEDAFCRSAYLESIRAFNGFKEVAPSDGVAKDSPEKFWQSFVNLMASMRREGFDARRGVIPVQENGEVFDGAHRLAIAAADGLNVETSPHERNELYDWRFFEQQGMDRAVMDYGALEYVKLNPAAFIVNLHPIADPRKEGDVRSILGRYGFVYYAKSMWPTFNGAVNLKKLSYGSFWDREGWIGTSENRFEGAQMHARRSLGDGRSPLRVYVFVCPSAEAVRKAKLEIRALFNVGNYSVHINDTHDEAVWLAETYFNENSWAVINRRPFAFEDERFDGMIDELRTFVASRKGCLEDVCATASTVLNVLGLRCCADFDFLCRKGSGLELKSTRTLSSVDDCWVRFYPVPVDEIIANPAYHFYFRGVKFTAPAVICEMKRRRKSDPKDRQDVKLLSAAMRSHSLRIALWRFRGRLKRMRRWVVCRKSDANGRRILSVFGGIELPLGGFSR